VQLPGQNRTTRVPGPPQALRIKAGLPLLPAPIATSDVRQRRPAAEPAGHRVGGRSRPTLSAAVASFTCSAGTIDTNASNTTMFTPTWLAAGGLRAAQNTGYWTPNFYLAGLGVFNASCTSCRHRPIAMAGDTDFGRAGRFTTFFWSRSNPITNVWIQRVSFGPQPVSSIFVLLKDGSWHTFGTPSLTSSSVSSYCAVPEASQGRVRISAQMVGIPGDLNNVSASIKGTGFRYVSFEFFGKGESSC
jgi:hypothetical protein